MSKFIAVASVMIICGLVNPGAQAQGQKPKTILFHVTAVQRVDDSAPCKAAECSVVRYRVEGYADADRDAITTSYVITCDELFYERPRPHRSNICARFHAGSAYTAELSSDSISFPHSGLNKAFETDYAIVSEKELPASVFPHSAPGTTEPREATGNPAPQETAKGPEQLASRATH